MIAISKPYADARAVAEVLTPSYPIYCPDLAGLPTHARSFVYAFNGFSAETFVEVQSVLK